MRSFLSLWVIGVLVAGCQEDGPLTDTSPRLASERPSLAFGEVPIGATKRLRLALRNEGNRALEIQDLQVMAPFFVEGLPNEVPAGAFVDVDVGYRPVQVEVHQGAISVVSSGGELSIGLSGEGVGSTVRVRPEQVDFGQLESGEQASIELVFEQLGPAEVGGPMVTEGFPRPEHYELLALGEDFRFLEDLVLPPRGVLVADLVYAPRIESVDDGVLRFEFCGARCGLEVAIKGEAGAGLLIAEPTALDFGTIGVGSFETQQVLVRNQGDRPIELLSADPLGDPSFSFELEPEAPLVLAPGDLASIRVRFAPTRPGSVEAEMQLQLPEGLFGPLVIPVFGEGEGPDFVVLPPDVGFGVLPRARVEEQQIVISNSGSSSLDVTAASIEGDAAYVLEPPQLPLTLQGGQSAFARLRFAPSSEGVFTATVSFSSTDPAKPQVDVDVRGAVGSAFCEIDVRPEIANFGVTLPGQERRREVLLRNLGNQSCEIRGLTPGPGFAPAFEISSGPMGTLSAGGEARVELVFRPNRETDAKATLFVETDDPILPRVPVGLVGTGAGYSELIAIPPLLDFGEVDVDCGPQGLSTRLVNLGSSEVSVTSVDLETVLPELTLNGRGSATLGGGLDETWGVTLTPDDLGPLQTEIRFEFERLPFPLFVPVSAEVVEVPRRIENFEQRDRSRTDVLFVIDDSCSMEDDQEALAENIQSFITQADLQSVSYRIGITTTSVTLRNGRLVGPVIDSDLLTPADVISNFRTQARVGITGSGFEQGLQAAVSAFEAARAGQGNNAGLLQRDAGVVLIIVSDEDDGSSEPVEFFFDALNRLVPDLVVAVVSGGEVGCLPSTFPAPRYVDFVRLTRGIGLDICRAWGPNLQSLGDFAFGLERSFGLEGQAEKGFPVVVEVNGVQVSNWSLDDERRVVTFDQPPPESAEIRVEYTPGCS
ncbi:MAG: choice-of-anchor D domain-containing protein [Myxococcota bacterium]